jgi:DNA-binding XRE family transcriptional regulator
MNVRTLEVKGRRIVQLAERDYLKLVRQAKMNALEADMPPLPSIGPDGSYPALEYARAALARDIISTRRRLGLSQVELARRAGIPPESLNRVERARTNPTIKTVEKIDRALRAAHTKGARYAVKAADSDDPYVQPPARKGVKGV